MSSLGPILLGTFGGSPGQASQAALLSSAQPAVPTIASPATLLEGTQVDFNCSTPYACLKDPVKLQWQGQDPARSVISDLHNLDPEGVSHTTTLHMALSWQDHDRVLSCQLSLGKHRAQGEIHLQVQCECPTWFWA